MRASGIHVKLLVDRLSATPKRLSFESDEAWWHSATTRLRELAEGGVPPFRFSLKAYHMSEDLYLEGEAQGGADLGCARCLERYRHAFREPFRLVLEPAGARIPAEPEAAAALARDGLCLGDEIEAGWFRGSEIDLGPFFLEVIALALPVQPLCREDCRGLCPHCGVDRNQVSCGCVEREVRSPFAALSKLRELGGGSKS